MSNHIKAAIFDLDGVITKTAEVHFQAWKKTFEAYLNNHTDSKNTRFTYKDDYVPFVDGKPRYDGVASFLKSRNIDLDYGKLSDQAGTQTICGIGNQKNIEFQKIIHNEGAEIYPASLKLIHELIEAGIKVGVASSSKNCSYILKKTKLIQLFETVVDGNTSKELGLKGKPEPDIFIKAAENIGFTPVDCIMFEDAISGVQAGKNGQFTLVIGITRTGNKDVLYENGADIVVNDLEEISLEEIRELYRKKID